MWKFKISIIILQPNLKTNTMNETQTKNELQRFTTLINPQTLSHIKLISYFTNQKLYEVVEKSFKDYVNNFEIQNKTSIKSIINFQQQFNKEEIKNNLPKKEVESKVESKDIKK
tara:strand:+ start:2501 stop:2842 length:342 start_codon:yes stop_codon:yes gene_type:complete